MVSNKYKEICTVSRPKAFVKEIGSDADEITKQSWTRSHCYYHTLWSSNTKNETAFEFKICYTFQNTAWTHCVASVADYSFSMYTPSIIAAASIAAALDGLEWTVKSGCSLNQLLDRLHIITAIERVSSGSLKARGWWEYLVLRWRKEQEEQKNCIMRSIMRCMYSAPNIYQGNNQDETDETYNTHGMVSGKF